MSQPITIKRMMVICLKFVMDQIRYISEELVYKRVLYLILSIFLFWNSNTLKKTQHIVQF